MSLVVLAVADGGPLTEKVMEVGINLSRVTDLSLRFVHVQDHGNGLASSDIADRAKQTLKTWARFDFGGRLDTEQGSESDILVPAARVSDLTVVARPGADPLRQEPAYIRDILFNSGRPVLVVPPAIRTNWTDKALVIWNETEQAARAVAGAMPLLRLARSVTVACVGPQGTLPPTRGILDYLECQGISADVVGVAADGESARARGRAIVNYAWMTESGFTVMGTYGDPSLPSFLGLGGATAKVIAGTRTALLMAR
jgi:nucleotide-binding universal stress UspA family protein